MIGLAFQERYRQLLFDDQIGQHLLYRTTCCAVRDFPSTIRQLVVPSRIRSADVPTKHLLEFDECVFIGVPKFQGMNERIMYSFGFNTNRSLPIKESGGPGDVCIIHNPIIARHTPCVGGGKP